MIQQGQRINCISGILLIIASVYFILYIELLDKLFTKRYADYGNFTNINESARTTKIEPVIPEKVTSNKNLTCLAGIVFAQGGGRLGNRLMEYASAWSVATLNGLRLVVADEIYNEISPMFSNLSGVSLSNFLSELHQNNEQCGEVAKRVFIRGEKELVKTSMGPWEEIKSKGPIVIKRYAVLDRIITRMGNSLQEELNYKYDLKSIAWQTLWKAANGINSTETDLQVVYVGVHVRRTDYHEFLHRKLGTTKFATEEYYDHAMKYMLQQINKNGNFRVVFAVTSDDMEYSTKTLIPHLENSLQIMGPLGSNTTVSWCGSKNYKNDLVLLSSCNHSIIAYGTYGVWAALMAGGKTVVFKLDDKGKEFGYALGFANILSNWTIMS